jgi:predicted porin
MKKSLIALAALGAFAGAASAQSSVTLYGLVDVNYQFIKQGDLRGGDNINKLADGTDYGPGSRWGLRVAEDLGSGLKANVVLESGFNADVGSSAQGGLLFGRQAFVSLASASLGEVRLGRQYTLHDEVQVLNNPFGNSTVLNPGAGAFGNVGGTLAAPTTKIPLFIDAVRQNNAVQYISPSFAGFRLQGMVAAGEGTAHRYQGVKGSYAQGPLNVALSYEQSDAGDTNVNKIVSLGGNYDFGVAKVFAGYQQGKDLAAGVGFSGSLAVPGLAATGATKLKAFTVGASVPFGAITVGANYTKSKLEDATGADRDLAKAGVVATYSLSKLTTVYAGYAQALGDLKEAVQEKQVFQLGLRKAF